MKLNKKVGVVSKTNMENIHMDPLAFTAKSQIQKRI